MLDREKGIAERNIEEVVFYENHMIQVEDNFVTASSPEEDGILVYNKQILFLEQLHKDLLVGIKKELRTSRNLSNLKIPFSDMPGLYIDLETIQGVVKILLSEKIEPIILPEPVRTSRENKTIDILGFIPTIYEGVFIEVVDVEVADVEIISKKENFLEEYAFVGDGSIPPQLRSQKAG